MSPIGSIDPIRPIPDPRFPERKLPKQPERKPKEKPAPPPPVPDIPMEPPPDPGTYPDPRKPKPKDIAAGIRDSIDDILWE